MSPETTAAFDVEVLRAQLPLLERFTYLNTGFSGPTSRPCVDAIAEYHRWQDEAGLTTKLAVEGSRDGRTRVRRTVSDLIGADPDEVALLTCTSDGIRAVVSGIDWRPGEEIVITDLEHQAGYLPAYWLEANWGVRYRMALLSPDELPDDAVDKIFDLVNERTRLILLSPVSYASGLLLPIEQLTERAHDAGVEILADGAQVPGHIPVDVHAWNIDYFSFPGQKWCLGPDGTGGLYVRRDLLAKLPAIPVTGAGNTIVHNIAGQYEITAQSAMKYESSTFNGAGLLGWQASLELLGGFGWERIYDQINLLSRRLRRGVASIPGVRLLSPTDHATATGLVTVGFDKGEAPDIVQALFRESKIVVRSVPSLGAVRFTTGHFNTAAEIDDVLEQIERLAK